MAFLIYLIFILLMTVSVSVSWEESRLETMPLSVVSGQDESEKNEALLLEKFRVLLGLRSFDRRKYHHGAMESPAPASAPAPAPLQSPAAAPILQPMAFHLHRRRQPHLNVPRRKINGHNGREKVLVVVLVSVCAALLVLGVGFLWFVKKYYLKRRRRKRCVRNLSAYSNDERRKEIVQEEVGFDMFYVNALSGVLEPEMELKVSSDHYGDSSNGGLVKKVEEGEDHNGADEIVCVDEISLSSGNESFHSLCDSNPSNITRLSNVSVSSFCDAMDGFSPKASIAPPPPPPPPPPPLTIQPTRFKMKCKSPGSSSSRTKEMPPNGVVGSPKGAPVAPKTPSSIPPPPIPPLLKMGSSLKGPPPPPPPLDSATLGKDGAPLPKLKPLHWDKVRATPDRSMVWDKLRSSSFEFDEEMIESLFGYNLKNVFQNDEGKSKTPSPNKHVLEPKRLQNMTILSKALNVSVEHVCEALVQGEGLRLQQLEALAKMEPTKEEETKLSNYKGNVSELGSAEKLVKAMLNIPCAFQRIEALLYRATFEDEVVHLRNSFSMLEEACKELRSSRLFLKLLEAVLKTGNRMNVGTIRGGAKAFKLDTLLKLADVKGTDGKTTLLHFVVQEIIRAEGIRMADSIMGKINRNSNKTRTMEEKEEDYKKMGLDLVCGLTAELCNVKKTASIDLDVLATSVSNLSEQMAKLQKLVTKELSKDADSSGFVGAMKTFISHGETSLRDLREHEARVLRSVKEITEYFHGEVGKDESNLLCIFVIVRDFLGMLDQVCRELRSLKSPNTLAPFH